MFKPELLSPAGNIDAFFAAIEAGADAVYMGAKKFNARNRAKNFNINEIDNAIKIAHSLNKKVYITLNTLIKNAELDELINELYILSQLKPDALIIQDFALINIINKFFPSLNIHASTQMVSHNTLAATFFEQYKIKRLILARELNKDELINIAKNSSVPIEIFVHGALCYSLSGQCLFSSFLGGNSANRGLCTQVCRRNFVINDNEKKSIFSLKDLQLIDYVPLFSELKIASLKIEGRMKSANYVYNTTNAYRIAIDNHNKIDFAKTLLEKDFAREKTQWFFNNDTEEAITTYSGNGSYLGYIEKINANSFEFYSDKKVELNYSIRIRKSDDTESSIIKICNITSKNNYYKLETQTANLRIGDLIYLVADNNNIKLKNKYKTQYKNTRIHNISDNTRIKMREALIVKNNRFVKNPIFFVRISDSNLLNLLAKYNIDKIIYKYTANDCLKLKSLNIKESLKDKIYIELPKFISQNELVIFKKQIYDLYKLGYHHYSISHISQLVLFSDLDVSILSNEHVYLLNDISINFVKRSGVNEFCYPLENDYPNILKSKDKSGIIPIYFYPDLFYSRMPASLTSTVFFDEDNLLYFNNEQNQFSVVNANIPVCLTHFANKFRQNNFNKFLIDLSLKANIADLDNIIDSFNESKKIVGTHDFNVKKELH